jgi:hypothetical protein
MPMWIPSVLTANVVMIGYVFSYLHCLLEIVGCSRVCGYVCWLLVVVVLCVGVLG